MRNRATAIFVAILVAGCQSGTMPGAGRVVVRSPYVEQQPKIIATVTGPEAVTACRDFLSAGQEVGKPYPSLAPLCRFEVFGRDNAKLVYDFCPYEAGSSILVWHKNKMMSVPVEKLRAWCKTYEVDFENNMRLLKKPAGGAVE
jgi:hypothetical protein